MGQRVGVETPSDWTRLRRPGPCPVPGAWYRASGQSPGRRATTTRTYFAAGQRSRSSPERRRTPNPERRIRSVQAKLTLRQPKKNVSAVQRPAEVGRGDSNPRPTDYESLKVLATLADQCRFEAFLQVRRVHLCELCAVLVGWFLSLRSLHGPCRSLRDLPDTESSASLQLGGRGGTMSQRIPLPMHSCSTSAGSDSELVRGSVRPDGPHTVYFTVWGPRRKAFWSCFRQAAR